MLLLGWRLIFLINNLNPGRHGPGQGNRTANTSPIRNQAFQPTLGKAIHQGSTQHPGDVSLCRKSNKLRAIYSFEF